jgi:hypothetical protein
MTSRGPRAAGRADVPGQLRMEWGAAPAESTAVPLPAIKPAAQPGEATHHNPLPLVQHLRWDFENTFPSPAEEAIENGLIEDDEVDTVRWIHLDHAKEALAVLDELDAVLDARRRGVDRATGKPPRTSATRERLRKFFETEPARLEQWYQTLMDTYEEAFGADARGAFDKALRARHAGVPVISDSASQVTLSHSQSSMESPNPPHDGKHTDSQSRRIVARLPVPKPLPSAIAAGHFGQEENDRPVRPGAHEVREITERHAEKLIDLLDSLASAPANGKDALQAQFDAGIAAYAEDFGQHAADQLQAYVKRQAGLDSSSRRER